MVCNLGVHQYGSPIIFLYVYDKLYLKIHFDLVFGEIRLEVPEDLMASYDINIFKMIDKVN